MVQLEAVVLAACTPQGFADQVWLYKSCKTIWWEIGKWNKRVGRYLSNLSTFTRINRAPKRVMGGWKLNSKIWGWTNLWCKGKISQRFIIKLIYKLYPKFSWRFIKHLVEFIAIKKLGAETNLQMFSRDNARGSRNMLTVIIFMS